MSQFIKRSDISVFYDHDVQYLIALFLTKPEWYKDHASEKFKQDYFFTRFRKFAENYYNFVGDEFVYFMSTYKELSGEVSVCGGGGSTKGSYARYFKTKYNQSREHRFTQIDDFAKKYGVSFEPGKDPRLFVGVKEIWNKLDKARELLIGTKWEDVVERAYDDLTFETPIPAKLDKKLVPFDIRNRAIQKYRNARRSATPPPRKNEEDDETEVKQEKKSTIVFVPLSEEDMEIDW